MAQDKLGQKIFDLSEGSVKGINDSNSNPASTVKAALTYLKTTMTGSADNYIFNANAVDKTVATGNGLEQLSDGMQIIIARGGSYFVVQGVSRGIMVAGDKVLKLPDDTRYNNAMETIAGYIGEANLAVKRTGLKSLSRNATSLVRLDKAKAALKSKKTGGVASVNAYAIAN